MKSLSIAPTFSTPTIKLDADTGFFLIEGRSIPEDADFFYKPILSWLEKYYDNPAPLTHIEIKLEYVNSGSSKYLLEFFRIIGRNYRTGHDCFVIWHYEEEDEAIQDLGEHYKTTIHIPFEFRIIKEKDRK
jgi:hypothetical protein